MKKKLAIFDFDGTLTKQDTMLEFTRFYWGDVRFLWGMFYLSPILLAYKMGWIPNWRAKEYFLTYFFGNEPYREFQEAGQRFGRQRIPALIRPAALRQLEAHRVEGCQLVIVSSSAEDWLSAWCRQQEVELIATRLQVEEKCLTGKLKGLNCYGEEKVNRLRTAYNLDGFSDIIVYGDSRGDFELFEIASAYFYKPFRK